MMNAFVSVCSLTENVPHTTTLETLAFVSCTSDPNGHRGHPPWLSVFLPVERRSSGFAVSLQLVKGPVVPPITSTGTTRIWLISHGHATRGCLRQLSRCRNNFTMCSPSPRRSRKHNALQYRGKVAWLPRFVACTYARATCGRADAVTQE